MFRARWFLGALMIGLVSALPAPRAQAMGVDVWTDRGKDAVYEPGEPVEIKVRASDDGYLLVYDIDSEGYVHVLYPYEGSTGYIEGRHAYRVPSGESGMQLVVDGQVGQGYIVALVSRQPFNALPRYLRPYDPTAESSGYVGEEDDEQDVTSDGRIMGDPFVAMERIRRQALDDPSDNEAFATAYTSYYIHQPVRYPRYLCNDCHRPDQWAWWDGFDPYYTSCSAFDFRVYWGWSWGPRYWFGNVPYFCYVPRCYPCAPYDRPYYSSWNGYRQWNTLWSGHLTRHKSPPPPGYTPPNRYDWSRWKEGKPLPPGFLAGDYVKGPGGVRLRPPVGGGGPSVREPGQGQGTRPGRPGAIQGPAGRPGNEGGTRNSGGQWGSTRPAPGRTQPGGGVSRPREESRPSSPPRYERRGEEPKPSSPPPRSERPREQAKPATPQPRDERPHDGSRRYSSWTPSAPQPREGVRGSRWSVQYRPPSGGASYSAPAPQYRQPAGGSRYAPRYQAPREASRAPSAPSYQRPSESPRQAPPPSSPPSRPAPSSSGWGGERRGGR